MPEHRQHQIVTKGRFMSPFFFNGLRRAGLVEATILDHQTVQYEDQELVLLHPEEITLDPAQKAYIWFSGLFYLETEAEHQERLQAEETKRLQAEETRKAREKAEQARRQHEAEEAKKFNTNLNIPVAWELGVKDVLSGLSERSSGDGMNKASVYHVLLLDNLQAGRLQREKGDFLCSSSPEMNGKRWSRPDREGLYVKVTCKACLKLAQRWQKK